jgi:hypothetical protein
LLRKQGLINAKEPDPDTGIFLSALVKHPELVADRIITFAQIVGRENVMAGTDCGLGGRVHSQIAWAKLFLFQVSREILSRSDTRNQKLETRNFAPRKALRDGPAIASKKLWS